MVLPYALPSLWASAALSNWRGRSQPAPPPSQGAQTGILRLRVGLPPTGEDIWFSGGGLQSSLRSGASALSKQVLTPEDLGNHTQQWLPT